MVPVIHIMLIENVKNIQLISFCLIYEYIEEESNEGMK
jgi:hypothetical protein